MKARKLLPFVFVAACLPALNADAQSVAQNVVPGYNSLTQCGTGPTPCFVPYGAGGGGGATFSASITRTANSTTYSALTAFANATTSATYSEIQNVCPRVGGTFLIPEVSVYSSYNPATKLQGAVWFFSTAPATPLNDNATFTISAADFAKVTGNLQGFAFTLSNTQGAGAVNSAATLAGTVYQGKCGTSTTSVFMMVETVNAYVPTSSEVLTVILSTVGN